MKVLVTGYNGQLGYDVVKKIRSSACDECIGVDLQDFDITDKMQTVEYIKNYHPDAVVHCAAYTAVDKAEDDAETCYKVNVTGTKNIAEACKEIDAKMLYVSTDYVYGGHGSEPIDPSAATDPQNVYGKTKLEGEEAVKSVLDKYFIVRTSWVFGINGNNFVRTMLRLAESRDTLNVVDDQIGSPTYTPDLAELIVEMIHSSNYGTYNGTNEDFCSWAEFAAAIMKLGNKNTKINPIPSSEYPTRATRPLNSRLSKTCLDPYFRRLPSWQDALERYFEELRRE
ncbi:MAG: dTDP-4-dehydrorhamnose reductase [Clostridia bacterium]|nr:dTDP-4-dehydrorhamnose reductase [Clostridia bacterium]